MAKFAPHMGDPRGDPQTSPQHADPHGFLVWFSSKRHQVHVDRRVVGWSAGRHADHPCGGGKFRNGLLEKSLIFTQNQNFKGNGSEGRLLLEGGTSADSCRSRENHRVANHRFCKPWV